MTKRTVFISYSHDSPEHSERVLNLAWALRSNGIDVKIDQFHNEEIVDWPRWCNEQTSAEHSEFVVCICTAEYRRRIEGKVPPEKGKGVHWEGSLLDDDLYDEKGNSRLIPVVLDDGLESSIPRFLRGWTHCRMRQFELDDSGYEHLIRILTGQAKVEKNALGTVPVLSTKRAPTGSPSTARLDFHVDISRIVKYAPAELIGRETETKLLADACDQAVRGKMKRPHVITFVALGGEGKTSLVAKWAAELAHQDWPGCDAVFAWSFYSQGTREQLAASSDLFLKEALTFFGDPELAGSAAGAFDKGRRLAQLVGQRWALLILDGLEPLQYAPTSPTPGELKDQGIAALLKGLATTSRGLCVVTTRYALPDLRAFLGKTAREERLSRLSRAAGVHLLQTLGVKGSLRKVIPSVDGRELWNDFEKLVEDVQGHALTLNLLGTYLRDAHAGDIRQRDRVKLAEADAEELGDHAFRVMDAYVRWLEGDHLTPSLSRRGGYGARRAGEGERGQRALALLRLLGLFDRPATADCLEVLWKAPVIPGLTEPLIGLSEAQRNVALERLESARLLTVNRDAAHRLVTLDAHPLIREYFAKRLRESSHLAPRDEPSTPDVATSGNASTISGASSAEAHYAERDGYSAYCAAHRRVYEHLCATTPNKDQSTLEDLQPLYQAVAHGCQAGLQQETWDKVFFTRIRRGDDDYSRKKLGAFGSDLGAVACFFKTPWQQPAPELTPTAQAWLLGEAGYDLSALGRLDEAREALWHAIEMAERQKWWLIAARQANTLSGVELVLGNVLAAINTAAQAVAFADYSGDISQQLSKRATHADALHQAGQFEQSQHLFDVAETMQANTQNGPPLLYGIAGFRCCDLLLAGAERAAWQVVLGNAEVSSVKLGGLPDEQSAIVSNSKWGGKDSGQASHSALDSLVTIKRRVFQTIDEKGPRYGIRDIGLDYLTLRRIELYWFLLDSYARHPVQGAPAYSAFDTALSYLSDALIKLRDSGYQHEIPRGLLTRAWLRVVAGERTGAESAQSDLDEAWEIAERGSMKLHMADIHLYRARLFGRPAVGESGAVRRPATTESNSGSVGRRATALGSDQYPWESPQADLSAARKLIEQCGYWRRKEELEDAEQALLGKRANQ